MGIVWNFMGHLVFFLVLSLLLSPATTHPQSNDGGHISLLLSDKGIDFAKDVLIEKALSSMIPLQIADIEKSKKIPLIGRVRVALTNITIYSVSIASSHVETGEDGIHILASGATAKLSMKWSYSYRNWIVVISDSGAASVQVQDMDVGLTVALKEEEGVIRLSVLDCGCDVKDISIDVEGGASWLYQAVVDAFEIPIRNAVEKAISKKLKNGIAKLDSLLEKVPKQVQIGPVATLDVSFSDSPVLSNSSIQFDIGGLFTEPDDFIVPYNYYEGTQASILDNCPAKMLRVLLDQNVFDTAASVYFDADYMHWTIDKLLNQSILNTAAWRSVYPQLYEQYPNDDMNLNIAVTTKPVPKIADHGVESTVHFDVTVNVLDAGQAVPVACISLVIDGSCSPQISGKNLSGILDLKSFSVSSKWSKIGDLDMDLVQAIMSSFLKSVFLPFMNSRFMEGISLPFPHVFTLQNSEIYYADSKIVVCTNFSIKFK